MYTVYETWVTDEDGKMQVAYSVEGSDVAMANEAARGFDTRREAWEWVSHNDTDDTRG